MDAFDTFGEGRPSEVIILGAGFSKAVRSDFPLTDDLGQQALDRAGIGLDDRHVQPTATSNSMFEQWMSRLAETQPYLSQGENEERHGLFRRLALAIVDVLRSLEYDNTSAPREADWFEEYVAALEYLRPTVVTLNYDELLEQEVRRRRCNGMGPFGPRGSWPSFVRPPEWGFRPPRLPGPIPEMERLEEVNDQLSFGLLKLHGSLSWVWKPEDVRGESVRRLLSFAVSVSSMQREIAAHQVLGCEPFIIPPASSKSFYYANGVCREIWRQAFEKIRSCDRLTLIGYSVPLTDTSVAGMLEEAVRRRRNVRLRIVNPDHQGVYQRLLMLGVNLEAVETYDSVASYVEDYLTSQSEGIVRKLSEAALPAGAPIYVVWRTYRNFVRQQVVRCHETALGLELGLSQQVEYPEAQVGAGQILAEYSLGDFLRSCTRHSGALILRKPDGTTCRVIGARLTERRNQGESRKPEFDLLLYPSRLRDAQPGATIPGAMSA